ncbi:MULTISPECIES: hypothetical protein [Methylocystis]|nr:MULTISPECIES: hypothetical protein [Methylocystis]MDJ0447556.1 hypothetical protein [Methylocystis sp. JR02]
MRLVLVEWASDRVLGDTADFAKDSAEWADCAFREIALEQLAVVAARLFDESRGRRGWRYQFACFGRKENTTYEIFTVNEEEEEAIFRPDASSIMQAVITRCAYAGFVRRKPPEPRIATLPNTKAA